MRPHIIKVGSGIHQRSFVAAAEQLTEGKSGGGNEQLCMALGFSSHFRCRHLSALSPVHGSNSIQFDLPEHGGSHS